MTTIEEKQTAEILRLYAVQDELVKELTHLRYRSNTDQAQHMISHASVRLLSKRKLVWPIRVLWKGWPIRFTKKGIRRDPFSRWYSRHGSREWYGVIQYIRIGPVILELGRDEVMKHARDKAIEDCGRMSKAAQTHAEITTQQTLQRINRTAGHRDLE